MDEKTVNNLLELQKLDSAIDALRLERDRSPVLEKLRLAEAEIERLENETADSRSRLESLSVHQSQLEREMAETEAKIEMIERQLYGGEVRATRELMGLQQELDHLKTKRRSLEPRLLDVMVEHEEVSGHLSTLQAELDAARKRRDAIAAEWASEEAEFQSKIAALTGSRDAVASSLDEDLLERYERLRAHLAGIAVVTLEGARCTGCNMDLSKAALEEIGATAHEIPRCENCGRMIVVVTTK